MNVALVVAGLAGLTAIVLECGFRDGARPVERGWLHLAEGAAVAVFVLDWLARLALAPRSSDYLQRNWGRLAMMALAALAGVAGLRTEIPGIASAYVLSLQAYLVAELLLRSAGLLRLPAFRGIGPAWGLIGGLAFLCLAGAGLLMLPVATPEPTSSQAKVLFFWDALFTSVSAATATGLTVRDTGRQFSPFGQAVILVLIQVGSLAVMVFGAAATMLVGKGLRVRSCRKLTAIAEGPGAGQVRRLAKFVVATSLAIEAAGAAMMFPMFAGAPDVDGASMSGASAVWQSVFHSVSAFCNAGFSLYGRGMMAGVNESAWGEPLRDHWQVLGVLAPLIVLGGVGLPVLAELGGYVWARACRLWGHLVRPDERPADRPSGAIEEAALPELSPHSRVVLWMTGILILVGAAGLVAVEPWPGGPGPAEARHPIGGGAGGGGDWDDMQLPRRLREGLFLSVSARTAGFNTIDLRELSDAGKWWTCGLMIVGGSPAGTAGGMKTVTVFLVIAAVWSFVRRREGGQPAGDAPGYAAAEALGGAVSSDLVRKAVSAAVLYLALLALVTLGVTILMRPGYSFMDLFFESCSACGNVGLSTGVTTSLTDPAKMVLAGGMLVGRLGGLTLLLAPRGRARLGEMLVTMG